MPTSSVTRSIQINAPVEQVFGFMSDPCRRMSAMSRVYKRRIAVSDVECSPEGAVTSWKLTTRFFPLPFNVTIAGIRTEHVVNQRIVEKASIRTKDTDEFTFEPSGSGTRLIWHSEFSAPNPLLVKLANFLAARGKSHEDQLEEVLAQVKRELETAPGPA